MSKIIKNYCIDIDAVKTGLLFKLNSNSDLVL